MKVKAIVIDTNVLISAILSPKGNPSKVVRYFIQNSRILFSEETYHEFHSRLWRPKFDPYITIEKRKEILLDFSNFAEWVEIGGNLKLSWDADDDKFIEVAINGNVDLLVSGDKDLTELNQVEGIQIYTPTEVS